MEQFLELLKEINIAQIVIVFVGLWFFYNRLDNKIEKLDHKIDAVEERLNKKIDAVEERLNKKIDAVEEQLNKRIDLLDKKIEAVQDKLTSRIDNLYNLFAGFLYGKKDDNVA